jgi:hypothetical protein
LEKWELNYYVALRDVSIRRQKKTNVHLFATEMITAETNGYSTFPE